MSEEAAQRRQLARLVRQLTESGRPQLEEQLVRRLKQLCRSSDRLVDAAYELQLLDQLFRRSHRLRQRAVADLQLIIDLCFETAGPLPPPAPAARRLTAAAAAALRHWHDTYAAGYRKLAVGYRFLQQSRPGDLLPSQEQETAALQAAEEQERRLERLKRAKLEQVEREIAERRQEMVSTMTEVENCFRLLLPDLALLDREEEGECSEEEEQERGEGGQEGEQELGECGQEGEEEREEGGQEGEQEHGECGQEALTGPRSAAEDTAKSESQESESDGSAGSPQYDPDWADSGVLRGHGQTARHRLSVTVPSRPEPLQVTADNAALVDTLRGLMAAVRRSQLPTVQRWIQLTRTAGGGGDTLRQLSAVRDALGSALRRYQALQLRPADGSSDDSDMEEVPELEDAAALVARAATRAGPVPAGSDGTAGPAATAGSAGTAGPVPAGSAGSAGTAGTACTAGPVPAGSAATASRAVAMTAGSDTTAGDAAGSASRRARLLARAPRLAYSADLVTWGRGPGPAAGPAPHQCETARVWRGAADCEPPPAESAHLRVTEFSGRWEPVRHRCGARLPSGRLCPRADRARCPLHGPVVPRDEHGEPLSPELRQREREARARGDDWQDPRLLAQLRASTGLDLTVGRGRRRQSGLTDLSRPASARQRLADKLFSGPTARRLAAALDRLDRRRHGDRFGDQFNY